MDVALPLVDLAAMHPLLLWDTLIPATAAVFADTHAGPPGAFALTVTDVPGFGSGELRRLVDPSGVSEDRSRRVRRTYEPSRLIELAAITIAAAGLHCTGGHEILDVAVRGSAADYLVDEARHHLEIAGRSRRLDFAAAWQHKWQRLAGRGGSGCYVCVAEFETPAGRLAFRVDREDSKMSAASPAVSDMLVTVKSREVQRALLAEMRGDRAAAARHFLAAAHLELVLADDYRESGDGDMALRSRLSAVSCFWRGREKEKAQRLLGELLQEHPSQAAAIQQVAEELARDHPLA
jgi:hypothetical protein